MSNDDSNLTNQGFPKTQLLGDDLNRKTFLSSAIVKHLPEYWKCYDQIVDKAAKITYGKYSYFLHLCYARKTKELQVEVEKLLVNY